MHLPTMPPRPPVLLSRHLCSCQVMNVRREGRSEYFKRREKSNAAKAIHKPRVHFLRAVEQHSRSFRIGVTSRHMTNARSRLLCHVKQSSKTSAMASFVYVIVRRAPRALLIYEPISSCTRCGCSACDGGRQQLQELFKEPVMPRTIDAVLRLCHRRPAAVTACFCAPAVVARMRAASACKSYL
jgi:hypothetical protein